jgi:hypothetical protein
LKPYCAEYVFDAALVRGRRPVNDPFKTSRHRGARIPLINEKYKALYQGHGFAGSNQSVAPCVIHCLFNSGCESNE